MFRHIVLFRLRKSLPQSQRLEAAENFKRRIEALKGVIPEIVSIHVALNANPEESWDIALVGDFRTLEDVAAYSRHPEHLAAASLLSDVKDERACVDYEF